MPNQSLKTHLLQPGIISYNQGLALQDDCHNKVSARRDTGYLIALQHRPVLTLGNRKLTNSLMVSEGFLQTAGIELVATDRGGDITAHNPGQLVVYPILPQGGHLTPRRYVCGLEESIIQCLRDFGITAHRDERNPGVWIGNNKIAAIGVRIHQKISKHGIALNVGNDLSIFNHIIACGVQGAGVTSMAQQLCQDIHISRVEPHLIRHLSLQLGLEILSGGEFNCPSQPTFV